VAAILARAKAGGSTVIRGSAGSSTVVLTAMLARAGAGPLLLVTAHLDDADEACDELTALGAGCVRVPAMEIAPGESGVNLDLLAERLRVARRLAEGDMPNVVVVPMPALMQRVPARAQLSTLLRTIRRGDRLDPAELARWLEARGYRRVPAIEAPGEFAVRGSIVDLFPAGGEPARLDLFGDEVETIAAIDLATMGSDRHLEEVELIGGSLAQVRRACVDELLPGLIPGRFTAILAETSEIAEQGRAYWERVSDDDAIAAPREALAAVVQRAAGVLELSLTAPEGPETIDLPVQALPAFSAGAPEAVREVCAMQSDGAIVIFVQNAGERDRLRELLPPGSRVDVEERYLHRGFQWLEGAPISLIPYHELLNRWQLRRRGAVRMGSGAGETLSGGRALEAFVDLQPGDYVVHREHGIARFAGLRTIEGDAAGEEFLVLEFARGAKLNAPASRMDLVQKYIGAFKGEPELSTLGGRRWKAQKEKVAEAVRDLAGEMLRLQAMRSALPGIRFPADTPWQREFEAEFPYDETEDQKAAINAVKRDMQTARPMDRLICGDVGFGKTEVAIRAAFKCVESGKQVAVLVPTTVLAEQHERTFRSRFADYPFRVESISRFRTGAEQKEILSRAASGDVDVLIGTHRLLSEDVHFRDLGLVVIDEEQRFGVEHKHRLHGLRAAADILTMTATPIPRTLHMSMLGLRDISSLTTAPLDRRAIVTEVIPWSAARLAEALKRELAREGQVFWLHNRVFDIESAVDQVRRLAPDAKVIYGHGQMSGRELEKVMLAFVRGEADVLVSTTIIESGVDIPRANTMIIEDAHMFGLSELHQLRGRVGRFKHRAYCYLLLPRDSTPTETAMQRLRALESFSMLGAGFRIALRDLEIRGAGNLLGIEQSGHISAVGYEMYCQLLEQAVQVLRDDKPAPRQLDATVDLGISGGIPRGWIPSDARRLDAYRRVSQANDLAALGRTEADLRSAYGEIPARARQLLDLAAIRIACAHMGIRSITRHEQDVIFLTSNPRALEVAFDGTRGSVRVVGSPDENGLMSIYHRPPPRGLEPASILALLRHRLVRPLEASVPHDGVGAEQGAESRSPQLPRGPAARPGRGR